MKQNHLVHFIGFTMPEKVLIYTVNFEEIHLNLSILENVIAGQHMLL